MLRCNMAALLLQVILMLFIYRQQTVRFMRLWCNSALLWFSEGTVPT